MKKFLVLIMVAAAMISCRKMPDMSRTDGKYFVYTAYDREADFSSFSTFHIADSVLVMGSGGAQYADASESRTAAEIIRFYEDCMTARGYVSVDNKYDADLGLYISYVEEIHNVTGFVDCCHPACKNINYANNKPQQWIMPQREKPMIVCR